MNKRRLIIILSFIILIAIVAFIILKFGSGIEKTNKITIYTTIYPDYDFCKAIVGDKMNVERLIEPGVEVHTYEPSSKDMAKIAKADMFIYTGKYMEPWAEKIINSIKDYDVKIVDASKGVELIDSSDFMENYSLLDEKNLEEGKESDHTDEKDGHIWMNPQNAVKMIDTILDEVVKLDPQNKDFYEKNADNYKNQILDLDKEIENTLKEKNVQTLVFGGEFAYSYFCERYNLKVVSCYTSCGENSEPSISRIKDVIEYINDNNIKTIFYEELSEGRISQMISEETKATAKVFNTLHNVTKEEIDEGDNYVTIMRDNLNKIID